MINQPSSFSQQKNNSNNRSKPDQSIIFDATPGNDTSDDFVDFEIIHDLNFITTGSLFFKSILW